MSQHRGLGWRVAGFRFRMESVVGGELGFMWGLRGTGWVEGGRKGGLDGA